MNRRERRYIEKLNKKSNKELIKDLQKMFPNQTINSNIKRTMDYQDFINNVELTPELIEQLNKYEDNGKLKGETPIFNIYNK